MSKKEIEGELRRLLAALMTGTKEESKKAKKEIDELQRHEHKTFYSGSHVALEYLPQFDHIKNVANKEAFVSGLSLFFLALADDHFEALKSFTLHVIQHPNGHIREAIRKTADWLYCSLTSRAEPFAWPEGSGLTDEQKTKQITAREQYVSYIKEIEVLLEWYDVEDENIEYVDEMKPSVAKSLEQLLGRLTESRAYQKILEATRQIPDEVLMKRKEIEEDFADIFKETTSDFSLEDVKDFIFHAEDNDDLMGIVKMFDRGGDASDLENILELATDAWNYFPHQSLGGLSPAEILLERKNNQK